MAFPSEGPTTVCGMQCSRVTGSMTHSDCHCVTQINTHTHTLTAVKRHFSVSLHRISLRQAVTQRQRTGLEQGMTNLGPAVNGTPMTTGMSLCFRHVLALS